MKYISLMFLISCVVLTASEKTGTKYYFNAGLNYNMHSADLKGFSGSENCCDTFTGGNFFDPAFGFGMELALGDLLFNLPASYNLGLNYNGMSSKYSEERFRGYKINEFDKDAVMVEHQLDPNISLFSIDNSIYNELFSGFSFGVGLGIGFVASANYEQNEIALSPSDFTFSNGKREINTASGKIEEMNSIILSLFTGVRYDLYSTDNWTLRPELKYNYTPISVLDGKELTISQLSGSISFVYNVTKSMPPPPPPPVEEPKLDTIVPAPAPPYIHVTLTLKDENNNEIVDGQNVNLPVTVYETKQEYALKPVVFFDSSAYNYKKYDIKSFTNTDFDVQSEMIKSIAEKMKTDNSLILTLTTYNLKDEADAIPQDRLFNIESKLKEYGVEAKRIKESIIALDKDFKYNELRDEYRRVEFVLSDNSDLIKSVYEIESKLKYNDMTFTPSTTIDASRDDYYRETTLQIDDKTIKTEHKDFSFTIDDKYSEYLKQKDKLQIRYNSSAEVVGIYNADNISFSIIPEIKSVKQTINTINDGTKVVEQYILAYTEFDKSNLESVDKDVLSLVRTALQNNKHVTIYASTDNLGNIEYNKALAERRANSVKSLIGGDSANLQVVYPDEYLFSNEHPYGRMLNRAIVVRIEK